MGDASQAKRFSEATDSFASSTFQDDLESEIEEESTIERIMVIYSHDPALCQSQGLASQATHCSSFDQLLLLLEDDRVDSILFDATVNHHERTYITGWAKIFRPTLTAHKLPIEKVAN